MEFTNNEISVIVIEKTASKSDDLQSRELTDLQLSFVGGGNHLITCG
jgi:hypothetical protein